MNATLPHCCTAPLRHWPLPIALPGVVLASNRFDPSQLHAEDFQRAAIEPPASIRRSIAKRQAEFLAGRLCARAALAHLGIEGWVAAIGEDRAPSWPAGLCGAITHGQGRAAAVAAHQADYRGLGLDLECLLTVERAERLHREILTAPECERLAQYPADALSLIATLTFSLKESLFKALYPLVGKRFYFEHAQVLAWDAEGRARLRLMTDLSEEWRQGAEFDGQFAIEDGALLSLVWIR
jgi:enterobactin synthetase component D